MALDHSRLGVENKFLAKQIRSNFLRSTSLLYKIIPANKSGCVQTNLLYFFIHHVRGKRVLWGAVFYHTDLVQNAVFHNFSRQIALIQYFGPRGLLAKPLKKFPISPIWPAGSNFWHALYLQRNLKELRFNMIKNLLCFFVY